MLRKVKRSLRIKLNNIDKIRDWQNFSKYLQTTERYLSPIKLPKYNKKSQFHKPVIYDKTGFKIKGNSIRLSPLKNLKQHLKEKQNIDIKYLIIHTGLGLGNLDILKTDKVVTIEYRVSNFVYGQMGVARCGDHLSGIRPFYNNILPDKPLTLGGIYFTKFI